VAKKSILAQINNAKINPGPHLIHCTAGKCKYVLSDQEILQLVGKDSYKKYVQLYKVFF